MQHAKTYLGLASAVALAIASAAATQVALAASSDSAGHPTSAQMPTPAEVATVSLGDKAQENTVRKLEEMQAKAALEEAQRKLREAAPAQAPLPAAPGVVARRADEVPQPIVEGLPEPAAQVIATYVSPSGAIADVRRGDAVVAVVHVGDKLDGWTVASIDLGVVAVERDRRIITFRKTGDKKRPITSETRIDTVKRVLSPMGGGSDVAVLPNSPSAPIQLPNPGAPVAGHFDDATTMVQVNPAPAIAPTLAPVQLPALPTLK